MCVIIHISFTPSKLTNNHTVVRPGWDIIYIKCPHISHIHAFVTVCFSKHADYYAFLSATIPRCQWTWMKHNLHGRKLNHSHMILDATLELVFGTQSVRICCWTESNFVIDWKVREAYFPFIIIVFNVLLQRCYCSGRLCSQRMNNSFMFTCLRARGNVLIYSTPVISRA